MAFPTQYRPADFRLERDVVGFAAVVADDFEAGSRFGGLRDFLGPALRAALGRGHVALVELVLFLLGEDENVLALDARNLRIGHRHSLTLWIRGTLADA